MPTPRLGAASVIVSISDADGFRVVHGDDGVTLLHKPPEDCQKSDWSELFSKLRDIAYREVEARVVAEIRESLQPYKIVAETINDDICNNDEDAHHFVIFVGSSWEIAETKPTLADADAWVAANGRPYDPENDE